MSKLQFIIDDVSSVAVKLNVCVVLELLKLLTGRLRVTFGAVVSTVKFLVTLEPLLLTWSTQETFQI